MVTWRGYQIEIRSYSGPGGRWHPRATVSWDEAGSPKSQPITGPPGRTFESKEPADQYAFELAGIWIDKRESTKGR